MPITKDGNGVVTYTEKEDLWDSDKTGVFADNDIAIAHRDMPMKQVKFQVSSSNSADADVTIKLYADSNVTMDLSNGIGVPNNGVKALMFQNLTEFTNFALPFAPVNGIAFSDGDKLFYNGETPDGLGGNIPGDYDASGIYVFTDNGDATGSLTRAPGWETGAVIPKGTLVHIGNAGSDGAFMEKNEYFQFTSEATIGSGDPLPSGPGVWSIRGRRINKTLTSQNITDQYVDLSAFANPETMDIALVRDLLIYDVDYSLSVVNNVTRITFLGDYASGGATPFVAGDILRCKFFV